MKYVKWIFVICIVCFFTSFIEIGKPTTGLTVGHKAPDFALRSTISTNNSSKVKSKYTLLCFWSAYDASSRITNMQLSHASAALGQEVQLISISFDPYASIFKETLKQDHLTNLSAFAVDTRGVNSPLYKRYKLENGFGSYLLDENNRIIAKNITGTELKNYFNE